MPASSSNFHSRSALVAQLDRAPGYEPVGREFESLQAHHLFQGVTISVVIPFLFTAHFIPLLSRV